VFAEGAVSLLNVGPALAPAAALALRISVLGFAARMPLAALQALLLGAQRQDRSSQLWIVMGWTKFACAILVLQWGGSLVHLVLAETLVHLAGGALQWIWVRREFPALQWSVRHVSREMAGALVSYGATLLLLNVTILIVEQTDRLVIGAFLPISEVTMYSAAWKLYMLAYAIPTTFVQALGPMIANLHGRGDQDAVRDLFFRVSKYSVALGIPLVCSLAACRELILTVWMGPRFVEAGPTVLVLLVSFYVTGHNHAAHSVMAGKRRLGALLWTYNGPQAVLNFVISVALVRPMGILGVALGTVIPALLLQPVFMRFAFAEVGVSISAFLQRVVRPTSGLALPVFLPLLAATLLTAPGSPVRLAVAAVCSAVFGVLFWLRGMSAGERMAVGPLLPLGLGRFLATRA
jgi:O-antigen/teichoic acid export membrane protein